MNINAATPTELIREFNLGQSTADFIIRVREELGGSFLNWRQLRERVGLDEMIVGLMRWRGVTFGPSVRDERLDVPGVRDTGAKRRHR